jgi:DNA invertase Pin-like site-specific DNA recombinase
MSKYEDILDEHPREFWEEQIKRWIFDEQARYALIRSLLDGVPYERIAEELNLSRTTVYKKITEYSEKLFKHI